MDICLPHYLHHSVALACLEAGKHVLIEKPLGITLKAARKIVEAGAKYSLVVSVAENVRRYLAARASRWAKLIGEPYAAFIQSIDCGPFDYENPAFKWRGVKLLVSGLYYGSKGMVKDRSFVFYCFQEGADYVLKNKQVLTRKQVEREYLLSLPGDRKEALFPCGCTDGFGIEVWEFIQAIKFKKQPEIDAAAGLKALALCEACYESATLGRPVKYQDVMTGKKDSYQKPIDQFWKI